MPVNINDRLTIDGRRITLTAEKEKTRVIIYHKAEGTVCTRRDPEGRPTIFEKLPKIRNGRWISVGRLDINTSGLLLLTNNGELANRLMKPNYEVVRRYAVRVLGNVTDDMIKQLMTGVKLTDGIAKFDELLFAGGKEGGANAWYHVTLREGRNREVRRLWESQDVKVSRLIRIDYGGIQLPSRLRQGRWEDLEETDIRALRQSVGL